jgi:hypothetical protein
MTTKSMLVSSRMERIAKQLATTHGMDWSQPGTHLLLAMPGRAECWLLINLDGERFSVTCCLVAQDNTLTPEVDMVFALHTDGWEPIELLYSHEAFSTYAQEVQAAGAAIYDAEGNLRFDAFTEYWAQLLEAQGWLDQAYQLPEPEAAGRQNATYSGHSPLQVVCDCPERCGAVLQLTHDGFLILEDKDGLQVSIMLPDWLDFAIRRALLVNTTAAADEDWTQEQAWEDVLDSLEDDVPF